MTTPTKRPTEAWHSANLFQSGFGQVIVARFKTNGEAEVGVFLVDTYCLGVKNAFFTRLWTGEYEEKFLQRMDQQEGREAISPACARRLVEGAVNYARSLGLEPHPDYRFGARVFGGIRPEDCDREFVYGHDGKPLFVSSPNDSPAFVNNVMNALTRSGGKDGFHCTLFVGSRSDQDDSKETSDDDGAPPTDEPGISNSSTEPRG